MTTLVDICVSVWLLVNVNSAIFQLYHGENKLIFIEMMMTYIEEECIQYNGQKKMCKRTNNDLQNIHLKLKIE
jgi:hypothetical protein